MLSVSWMFCTVSRLVRLRERAREAVMKRKSALMSAGMETLSRC
jgi:hypothetical protein